MAALRHAEICGCRDCQVRLLLGACREARDTCRSIAGSYDDPPTDAADVPTFATSAAGTLAAAVETVEEMRRRAI